MQSITLRFLANIPYIPVGTINKLELVSVFPEFPPTDKQMGDDEVGGRRATLGDPRARNFSASCWEIALLPATAGAWF